MNLYPFLRPLLFAINAETAHQLTLKALNIVHAAGWIDSFFPKLIDNPVKVMGLTFKNPVGLAAGLDKNGDYIDCLAALGFGFLEIGTVTPRPQAGNPKPRLFRIPEHQAIINRMGFNNKGIDHLIEQVGKSSYQGILGINIGKNADTPIERAQEDYLIGLGKAYPVADYVTINISSPNTKNLRQLQQSDESRKLVSSLKEEQLKLQSEHGKYVPIAIKIAPDLTSEDIVRLAKLLLEFEIDGVIATNTTIDRLMIGDHPLALENGGLSGRPVMGKSTTVVKRLAAELQGKIPIIAAGGILSAEDAREKFAAGAQLIQLYSGLIYKGPQLLEEILGKLPDAETSA